MLNPSSNLPVPPEKNSNPFFSQRLLMLGFLVAVLSVIGGITVSLVMAEWSNPVGEPTDIMPPGPVYLLPADIYVSADTQTGGIKLSGDIAAADIIANDATLSRLALGGWAIDPLWNLTTPNVYIGNGAFGTIISEGLITTDIGLQLMESGTDPEFYTTFQAAEQTGNITYTLPSSQGAAGTYLRTTDTGVLSWATVDAVGGSTAWDDITDLPDSCAGSNFVQGIDPTNNNLICGTPTFTPPEVSVSSDDTIDGDGTAAAPLKIAQQGATPNQVLQWNGTTWIPTSLPAAVTAITAGNGIKVDSTDSSRPIISLATDGCSDGEILQFNGTTWTCQSAASAALPTCPNGYILKYITNPPAPETPGWKCKPDEIGEFTDPPPAYNPPSVIAFSAPTNGNAGGYALANARCTAASAGSHICTVNEVIDTLNRGALPPTLTLSRRYWVSAGVPFPSTTATSNDCSGWKDGTANYSGITWYWYPGTSDNESLMEFCNASHPFLCCK